MCEIVTPIYVYNQYINLHEKSILDLKWSGQNFRFKSFIWPAGTVLTIVDLFAIALGVYKCTITPLRKTSNYSYILYTFVGGGIAVLLINIVVFVVIIIKRKKHLIELPKPFLILTKQNKIEMSVHNLFCSISLYNDSLNIFSVHFPCHWDICCNIGRSSYCTCSLVIGYHRSCILTVYVHLCL